HHPQTLRLCELVQQGAVGELRWIGATFAFTVADPRTDIRYDAELAGGALRDLGCYAVSAASLLAGGQPREVIGIAQWALSGVDRSFYGTLAFDNEVVAQFDCSLAAPLRLGLTVTGSDGELLIRSPWYPHLPPQAIEHSYRSGAVRVIPVPGE